MQLLSVMEKEAFYVRSTGGAWAVFSRKGGRLSELMGNRPDAVIHAKELARRAGSAQILVFGEDGKLDSEFFYGRDERAALASDDSAPSIAASTPAHGHGPRG